MSHITKRFVCRWCICNSVRTCLVPVLLLLGILYAPVGATTLVEQSFDDLVVMSDQVFIGTVVDIKSQLSPSEKSIYTYVTFSNLEDIAGLDVLEDTYTLRFTGGTVGNRHSLIVGMPRFELGQRVLLFSHLNGEAMCPLVGWTQGCFHVESFGQDEIVLDASRNAITDIDGNGRLLRADNPAAQGSPAPVGFLGYSDDGHSAGEVVANVQNSIQPMTVDEFIDRIHVSRDAQGYQPFIISPTPNQWIPMPDDPNDLHLLINQLAPPALAPYRNDAWIPQAVEIDLPVADDQSLPMVEEEVSK